jgi:hypothetical protein
VFFAVGENKNLEFFRNSKNSREGLSHDVVLKVKFSLIHVAYLLLETDDSEVSVRNYSNQEVHKDHKHENNENIVHEPN